MRIHSNFGISVKDTSASVHVEPHPPGQIRCAMYLCVKGMQVLNSLCDDLKIVNTVAVFKRKCKNLLFKKYLVSPNYIICQDVYLCYTLYMNV